MEKTKEINLMSENIEDVKLQELVGRFNRLIQEFADEGYLVQPYNQPNIRIVKIDKGKKFNFNPFKK